MPLFTETPSIRAVPRMTGSRKAPEAQFTRPRCPSPRNVASSAETQTSEKVGQHIPFGVQRNVRFKISERERERNRFPSKDDHHFDSIYPAESDQFSMKSPAINLRKLEKQQISKNSTPTIKRGEFRSAPAHFVPRKLQDLFPAPPPPIQSTGENETRIPTTKQDLQKRNDSNEKPQPATMHRPIKGNRLTELPQHRAHDKTPSPLRRSPSRPSSSNRFAPRGASMSLAVSQMAATQSSPMRSTSPTSHVKTPASRKKYYP